MASDRADCLAGCTAVPTEGVWSATWQNGLARAAFLALVLVFTFVWLNLRRPAPAHPHGPVLLLVFWLDFVTHMPTQNPSAQRSVYTPGWASAHLKFDAAAPAGPIAA